MFKHIVDYAMLSSPIFSPQRTAFTVQSEKLLPRKIMDEFLMPEPHDNNNV